MAGRAPFLPEQISRYIAEHAVREPQVLRELRKATAPVKWSGMQIGRASCRERVLTGV